MHGSWRRLRDPDKAEAYLRQAVVNRSRSGLRRRKVEIKHAPKPGPDAPSAEYGALGELDRTAVIEALRLLPRRQREVLVLRYYGDLSRGSDRRDPRHQHRRRQEPRLTRHGRPSYHLGTLGEVVMNHPDEPLDPREEALVRALHARGRDGTACRRRPGPHPGAGRAPPGPVPDGSCPRRAPPLSLPRSPRSSPRAGFGGGKHASQLSLGAASLTAATTPVVALTTKAKRTAADRGSRRHRSAATTAAVRTEATVLASPRRRTTTPSRHPDRPSPPTSPP